MRCQSWAEAVGQRLVDAHARHVDQRAERAERADRLVDRAPGVVLAGDVAGERHHPGARDRVRSRLAAASAASPSASTSDDRRAFLGEHAPGRLADTAAAAGDERDAAVHAARHRAPTRAAATGRAARRCARVAAGTQSRRAAPRPTPSGRGRTPGPGRAAGVPCSRSARAAVMQAPAHLDDRRVAGAQVLAGAIHDGSLALLDGLILDAEAGDAAEHLRAVQLPVHLVVVAAVGARCGCRRRAPRWRGAYSITCEPLPSTCGMSSSRVSGRSGCQVTIQLTTCGVVHRHPDVRLHDPGLEIGRRHRVERQQVLRHAPVVLAVAARAAGADQHAVVGVDDVEARRPVAGLHGRAHAEARPVQLGHACSASSGCSGRVQEADVAGVDAALHRLEPVALLHALGGEDVRAPAAASTRARAAAAAGSAGPM